MRLIIKTSAKTKQRLPRSASKIKFVVFDFDGVFTDNRVFVDENGREGVFCSRSDGWGLQRLRHLGVQTLVLSTETNPVVSVRCAKLKIDCRQGCAQKEKILKEEIKKRGIAPARVAYIGNDVNDIECLKMAGIAAAPVDAHPCVFPFVQYVTTAAGGHGAAREFADLIADAVEKK